MMSPISFSQMVHSYMPPSDKGSLNVITKIALAALAAIATIVWNGTGALYHLACSGVSERTKQFTRAAFDDLQNLRADFRPEKNNLQMVLYVPPQSRDMFFISDEEMTLDELKQLYWRAESALTITIFIDVHLLMIRSKGVLMPNLRRDGRIIANLLDSYSLNTQEAENTIFQLRKQQDDVDLCRRKYREAGGEDTFSFVEMFPFIRGVYAQTIGMLELELIKLVHTLYRELQMEIPYELPINGHKLALDNIPNDYKQMVVGLQQSIDHLKIADEYIVKYRGQFTTEIEEKIRRPLPQYCLDFALVISGYECEIVKTAHYTNFLITSEIKEDETVEEDVKEHIVPIPYAYPIDVDKALLSLKKSLEWLATSQSEKSSHYQGELNNFCSTLQCFQTLLSLLRSLNPNQAQPSVSVDEQTYRKQFEGKLVISESVEQQVGDVLNACQLESEALDPEMPSGYNEFKSKVIKAKKLMNKTCLKPSYFFDSDLNKSMKKLAAVLHPDKQDTLEAKELFTCMKALYEIEKKQ